MAKIATPSALVGQAYAVIAEMVTKAAELKGIEEKLIALGAGRYCDEIESGKACTVVAAVEGSTGAVSYWLPDEAKARALAGDAYPKLFDRTVIFSPCKGFADLAPKLLTPARARDLTALCLVPGKAISGKKAHILWR